MNQIKQFHTSPLHLSCHPKTKCVTFSLALIPSSKVNFTHFVYRLWQVSPHHTTSQHKQLPPPKHHFYLNTQIFYASHHFLVPLNGETLQEMGEPARWFSSFQNSPPPLPEKKVKKIKKIKLEKKLLTSWYWKMAKAHRPQAPVCSSATCIYFNI